MTALDDLIAALDTAERSVFRLEGHQEYPDDELWQAHLRGEAWEQAEDLAEWCALVSATVARGVSWTRARVVTEPRTPYTRWEIEQHYPHNIAAGEDVRLVHWPEPWDGPDFWMVDERAWMLHYDDSDGTMHVVEATTNARKSLRLWRAQAMRVAESPRVPASP